MYRVIVLIAYFIPAIAHAQVIECSSFSSGSASPDGDIVSIGLPLIGIAANSQYVAHVGPIECQSALFGCPGDCDASGAVDFNDLVATLFAFGEGASECDTDASGIVDFNDLVATLFLFGPCE